MKAFYSYLSLMALIMIFQVSQSATPGALNTAVTAPYFENFDQVTSPDLPAGWSKIVQHTGTAQVHTVTYGPPVSAPNNVRLYANQEQDANVMLITPLLENPSANRIRFWARPNNTTNVPSLIIGTLSNPGDASTFTEISTIPATNFPNVYQEYIVNLNVLSNASTHIAFKFGPTPSTYRAIYIDDFHYEPMPAHPVFNIDNPGWNFGQVDIVEMSLPKTFSITNEGLGQLQILSVSSDNNVDFILDDLGNFPAVISGAQTADFTVVFSPEETGNKTAQLTITYNTGKGGADEVFIVNLQGEGVARPAGSTCGNPYYITEFPFSDFNGTTSDKGNFYSTAWVSPSTAYLHGNDMVFQFTLDHVSYINGSITTPQNWTGMLVVEACPNLANPPQVLKLAGTGTGNTASFEEFTLQAGTYFLIVGSFSPPPQLSSP
jgi:hypothetical protein